MNIIVHYPKSADAVAELEKRVANVHAEAVVSHLSSLPCPKSQKLLMVENLKKQYN